MSAIDDILNAAGYDLSGQRKKHDDTSSTLANLLKQAVAGERSALDRVTELEESIVTLKRRAQNNIDRSYNRGLSAGVRADECPGNRTVRFPEYGTD